MLNVNSALYTSKGIDTQSVQAVSKQILNNSKNAEPVVSGIDYSKFNRATLGVDLYSSRTNTELQKQIALTQAGLYAKAVNVAKLNAMAAANLYSASTVQKNVEMTQSKAISELNPAIEAQKQANVIQLFAASDKNSNSSNGFNPFRAEKEENSKEEKVENLFV